MNATLKPGVTATRRIEVDRARTIDFMGEDLRVYATPALLRDVELTARDLLLEHLDPGEDSVGTEVELAHVAATPLGLWAEVSVTVSAVEGRRVALSFAVRDAVEEVARGRHSRFVVDKAKTGARIAAKIAQAKG